MVEDKRARYLILLKLDDYIVARGSFGKGDAIDQRMTLSPEKWWYLYGGECPELQNFAIRILSQTCTGALRYGLRRSLSEQLHTNGRNCIEQKQLTDLTFVHHNLRLQNPVSISSTDYRDIFLEEIDPLDEWVGGGDVKESTGMEFNKLYLRSQFRRCHSLAYLVLFCSLCFNGGVEMFRGI
ncbi:uncharacterized protein LOC113290270 [Papaver somniferum]|uniref:uncharacterized protein LOC113290270 n=1 Tax=Papaver somniferum TaxID=3469 RepID=UPI000E6FCF9E|nr:uncharacterized protein LOC113290270 [Papaver somniferum]